MAYSTVQMRFPGGRAKALTLSYDDGVKEDIRLVKLMQQHGIKGTFNINAGLFSPEDYDYASRAWGGRLKRSDAVALFTDSGMEVASHSYTHPYLEQRPYPQQVYEIVRDRAELEQTFGCIVRGGAYPYGTYNEETVEALKAAGIVYWRTVENTEGFDIPTDWLRLPGTCHHKSPKLPALTERFLAAAPEEKEPPMLFYLWGHSYEFERDHNWEVIEHFAERVGGHDDIWYATNIEIYDYVHAWEQLIFSLDMTRVSNPTAQTLCFTASGKGYTVPAGASIVLE